MIRHPARILALVTGLTLVFNSGVGLAQLACPTGAATVAISAENLSADASVRVAVAGELLDPETREEHALARTERKTGPGYHGFVFHADRDVTLEDDLLRRDLTINAIAEDEDGTVIDPHGGRSDLAAKVLRHVSPASMPLSRTTMRTFG